jgi:hypothetical protein
MPIAFVLVMLSLTGTHLQVALATLIADGAVQGVIDEHKLHHSLARLLDQLCVGLDHHAWSSRHGTGGNRFWGLRDLHETHSTVARNGQLLMIAKAGNIYTSCFACLYQ